MAKAASNVFSNSKITEFPLADGGEGSIEVIHKLLGGTMKTSQISDPLMRKISAKWLQKDDVTYIELAQTAGLTLIKKEEQNPLKTTTYGVGELLKKSATAGNRNIFLGVGGSATTDAGIGALIALGVKFYKKNGTLIYPGTGEDLSEITKIDTTSILPEILKCKITILSDVENPLYGKDGAAFVYAPQKGADKKMVQLLDLGLRNCAEKMEQLSQRKVSSIPGAGAAGGIVAGLASFLDVAVVSGIDTIMQMGGFENILKTSDLILTGEGKIDNQTFFGKSLSKVFKLTEKHNKLTLAFAGKVEDAVYKKNLKKIVFTSITPSSITIEKAMLTAKTNLYNSVNQRLKLYKDSFPS
jgi:glycerate kinase